ncbi:hypothetical protein BYT27DRAFT_6676704 [Phlegmacium glaucopus]|nr:hypothetical protein BYT27DRAFT_6676704 [Phlegmacium glaucopus]
MTRTARISRLLRSLIAPRIHRSLNSRLCVLASSRTIVTRTNCKPKKWCTSRTHSRLCQLKQARAALASSRNLKSIDSRKDDSMRWRIAFAADLNEISRQH